MRIRTTSWLSLMIVTLFLAINTDTAVSQRVDIQRVAIEGVITEMLPNQITIRSDGKLYAADVAEVRAVPGGGILDIAPPNFTIKGQRSVDSLQKGMFIKFEAEIERYKKATDTVSRLTVFSRTPFTEFGFIKPPAPALDDPNLAEKLEARDAEASGKSKGPKRFIVAGVLEKYSGSKITMIVPHEGDQRKVTAMISPDTIVDFNMNTLNFAAVGNRIVAKGDAVRLPHFFATDVTVFVEPDKKLAKLRERLREEAVTEGRDPDEVDRMIAGNPLEEMKEEPDDAPMLADGGGAGKGVEDKDDTMAEMMKEKMDAEKEAVIPSDAPKPFAPAMVDDADSEKIDGRRKRGLTSKVIKIN